MLAWLAEREQLRRWILIRRQSYDDFPILHLYILPWYLHILQKKAGEDDKTTQFPPYFYTFNAVTAP